MRGLLADLHVHTNFSDGRHSVAEIVDFYGKLNFDVIAITDHFSDTQKVIGKVANYLNYSLNDQKWPRYLETIEREAERAWRQYGLRVLTGFEVTKNSFNNNKSCHFLVIGAEAVLPASTPVLESLIEYRRQNALTIAAHPLSTGEWEFQSLHLWYNRELYKNYFDAWEVNCGKKYFAEVAESGLPIIASTDLHHMKQIDTYKTLIYANNTQTEIFEAIREQRIKIIEYSSTLKANAHQFLTQPSSKAVLSY